MHDSASTFWLCLSIGAGEQRFWGLCPKDVLFLLGGAALPGRSASGPGRQQVPSPDQADLLRPRGHHTWDLACCSLPMDRQGETQSGETLSVGEILVTQD